MISKFKAIVINQTADEFSREIKTLDRSFFKYGDVTVKVDYSGLNYKDALILKNGGKLVKVYPHIPGIDFSGKVIESKSGDFKIGDDVVLTGCKVGEIYPGGYSQLVKVKSELLIKKPKFISNKNAMILGTAGFTSLLCAFAIKAREELLLGEKVNDVLVTGATGGVGSIAIMILSKFGYNVTAVTGKKDKSNYLKAEEIYNVLIKNNIDVLFDDTDEHLSAKFKKFDLIGIPYQIILGSKSTNDKFEFKEVNGETENLSLEEIKNKLINKRNSN